MADLHGSFIWYELLTGDADAAQDFYGKVLGWTFSDSGQADMDYRLFNAGSEMVGGLMALTDEMKSGGAQPCWLGYVGVDDTDAAVKKIVANGGAELMPAMDIPDVGRMAMVADPQGAPFYVMTRSRVTMERSARPLPPKRPRSAIAHGTNWPPAIQMRRSNFTLTSLAGHKMATWTWARWALTGSCAMATL